MNNLSLDFMQMDSLKTATMEERVNIILEKIKANKIIVFDSRFDPKEEAVLIKKTMENVNKTFPGIELCSLSSNDFKKEKGLVDKVKNAILNLIMGGNRGITVIGPAKVIKQIKRDEQVISLLTK
jgi:hypothetical protein